MNQQMTTQHLIVQKLTELFYRAAWSHSARFLHIQQHECGLLCLLTRWRILDVRFLWLFTPWPRATPCGWECMSLILFFKIPTGLCLTGSRCHQVSSQGLRGTFMITKTNSYSHWKDSKSVVIRWNRWPVTWSFEIVCWELKKKN